jgi:ribosomal protein S1
MYNSPSVGDTIEIRVMSINPELGIFARMPNGIDGLIRLKDVSWINPSIVLPSISVGDRFKVKVIYELPDGKLNLSRKELMPNPAALQANTMVVGNVCKVESYGVFVKIGDFTALAPYSELSCVNYDEGDEMMAVVKENTFDEKHRRRIILSTKILNHDFAVHHTLGEIVSATFERRIEKEGTISAVVSIDGLRFDVPAKRFIAPYRSLLENNELETGGTYDFLFDKYDENYRTIVLDMRPILKKQETEKLNFLKSQIERGDILEAEVLDVNNKEAKIALIGTDIDVILPREELSPNKVIRASDEVFIGENITVVYLGEGPNGKPLFSRKYLVEDKYDESLYELSLLELLATMDINTSRFIGKVISINGSYFFTDLITDVDSDTIESGKLLIDPVNGKSLIVILDHRLRNFVTEGEFYSISIDLAEKEYRQNAGTPYQFHVVSNDIKRVSNPYLDSVALSFKQHTSPNTNTSVANLLEEVGQNLYTSKKRMFFELLQNADDSAAENGVKVKLQICGQYFVLTHDGYAFNRHDFESVTSAAKSTKSANKKKTGYKGIGFKSVFTNSNTVLIKSGGFEFAFDKYLEMYNHFEEFYFHVNDIENNAQEQAKFLHKYSKYHREFNGVKDIPWQLLPIWSQGRRIDESDSIFNQKENVAIALRMDDDTLSEYGTAVKEVFDEPRFMLFLRNTHRIQLINDNECLTIQKNVSKDGKTINLVNSFKDKSRKDCYRIYTIDNIIVDDEAFAKAGILIRRKERINNRGERENYFVRIDKDGKELSEVPGIPDRIASATETSISFALQLDSDGHIITISKDDLSLYAYLPMSEHRFKFPFFINADFIPKSDREGVQSDNPWNYFLFYNIGRSILSMVADNAATEETEYLNLLPTKSFESTSQDTSLLVDAFNKGYEDALSETNYILNDLGAKVGHDSIIVDKSGLAEAIGNEDFYTIIGTKKRLPHRGIKSDVLSKEIFDVETVTEKFVVSAISSNSAIVLKWIKDADDSKRANFYGWLASNEEGQKLIKSVPSIKYGENWISYSEAISKPNQIIITNKLLPIKGILSKLGFLCSDTVIDTHPLVEYLVKQNEKQLFSAIQSKDCTTLSYNERLQLFNCCTGFEEIGKETLSKWNLFKNVSGTYAPLASMCANTPSRPVWLSSYVINIEENHPDLAQYLVKDESIYSSIIEQNIDDILTKTDISNIYSAYRQSWQQSFTVKLIAKNTANILYVVEQSDSTTKVQYIKSLKAFALSSGVQYSNTSVEYRIINIAAGLDAGIQHLRSIITVDGTKLLEITLKDEFSVSVNNVQYPFSLSKILPNFSSSSNLSTVASNFTSITGADKIFAQNEALPVNVRNQLYEYLSKHNFYLTAEQFCFLMMYRRSSGYLSFDPTIRTIVKVNNVDVFKSILDRCFSGDMGDTLGSFLKDSYVTYPCGKLGGTYIDCDRYTLPIERVPSFIAQWADTDEKKSFLIKLGVHDLESQEIKRRISFTEKKNENIWNITERSIINSFLNWVKDSGSFTLPICDENQVAILEELFQTVRTSGVYYEEDFSDSKEWTNELYLEWKSAGKASIYLIDGLLPYRGIYNNTHIFNSYTGEYTYFTNSNKIYISTNREPASVLADVYSNRSIPFTKDDWNSIFLVSAEVVKEKDQQIAELQRLLEEARNNRNNDDAEVDEHGEYTEKDNTDEQSRYEINREARLAAKDYLDCLSDYDCSAWDPETGNHLIKDLIKYKGKPIVVAVLSSQKSKLYLHPHAFADLMEDPDNLLLNYGSDKRIHPLSFDDIFADNPNVNLIFDTDVISPNEIADLANRYMYSRKTCFVIENPRYSQSDTIKSFGLNEKKEDGFVDTSFTLDDIFG